MAVDGVLCMKGGTDQTSYATNSSLQRTVIRKVGALVEESIKALCSTTNPDCLTVADLGCSSGPNTLSVVQSVLNVAISICRESGQRVPELNVFLNDLPQNDFNTVFKSLPSFYKEIEEEKGVQVSCFVSGTPGSFYGRLFHRNVVHFMHSSYSLHWLSQVPRGLVGDRDEALNKGYVHACKEGPPRVLEAYREQFSQDFTHFLKCRSIEIVDGGRMVLALPVSQETEVMSVMDMISKSFYKLASQGLVDREKLDHFNLPYYRPRVELVKQLIEDEGSFTLNKLEIFNLPWIDIPKEVGQNNADSEEVDIAKVSKFAMKTMRAVFESSFASVFGEEIMDDVFSLAEGFLADSLSTLGEMVCTINLVVSLIKRG